ncbi:hypothetical protein [Azospirillum palustre]
MVVVGPGGTGRERDGEEGGGKESGGGGGFQHGITCGVKRAPKRPMDHTLRHPA